MSIYISTQYESFLFIIDISFNDKKNNDLTVHSDRCLVSKGFLILDSIRKYNKTLRYDVGDEFLDELKDTDSGEMPPNSIFVLYAYSRGNLLTKAMRHRLCCIILIRVLYR